MPEESVLAYALIFIAAIIGLIIFCKRIEQEQEKRHRESEWEWCYGTDTQASST